MALMYSRRVQGQPRPKKSNFHNLQFTAAAAAILKSFSVVYIFFAAGFRQAGTILSFTGCDKNRSIYGKLRWFLVLDAFQMYRHYVSNGEFASFQGKQSGDGWGSIDLIQCVCR